MGLPGDANVPADEGIENNANAMRGVRALLAIEANKTMSEIAGDQIGVRALELAVANSQRATATPERTYPMPWDKTNRQADGKRVKGELPAEGASTVACFDILRRE